MSGFALGLVAFASMAIALFLWFRWMNDVSLGGRRAPLLALCGVAVVFGVLALTREPGWIGGALAVLAVAGGAVWLGLRLLAGQSKQAPAIALGQPMIAFSAPDHEGNAFEIGSLRGHPVLIKLFRGHW